MLCTCLQGSLELRESREGHHSAETSLEGPVLRKSFPHIGILDVFLDSVKWDDVVSLRRSELFPVSKSFKPIDDMA